MRATFLILLFLIPSVAYSAQPIECGTEWINIHKNNPDLVGIYVNQLPDDIEDAKLYKGKHPVAVYYLFANDMVHCVKYTPIGQIEDGTWWPAKESPWIYEKVTKEFKEDVFCHFSVTKSSNQSIKRDD